MEKMYQTRWPKVKLITFGSGIPSIGRALERLSRQSKKFSLIDEFQIFTEKDLDQNYFDVFGHLHGEGSIGFGFWSWKPYLIQNQMLGLSEGDVLIYVDAGVELNKKGLSRFTYYLDHVARNDILLFSLDHQHRHWTKDSPEIFNTDRNFFRNQVVAGILMFRVSSSSRLFVEDWLKLCMVGRSSLLSDPVTGSPEQHKQLHEHRHDQSLLSWTAFEHEIQTIPDETMFRPWRDGRRFPFLALRNTKSRYSWIWWATRLPFVVWHVVYLMSSSTVMAKRRIGKRIRK
jgi:hypothetical protein